MNPTNGKKRPILPPNAKNRGLLKFNHLVQFYDSDALLIESVGAFIGAGLESGISGIVIATKEHQDPIEEHLKRRGLPIDEIRERGE
jgi:hypothetical protein